MVPGWYYALDFRSQKWKLVCPEPRSQILDRLALVNQEFLPFLPTSIGCNISAGMAHSRKYRLSEHCNVPYGRFILNDSRCHFDLNDVGVVSESLASENQLDVSCFAVNNASLFTGESKRKAWRFVLRTSEKCLSTYSFFAMSEPSRVHNGTSLVCICRVHMSTTTQYMRCCPGRCPRLCDSKGGRTLLGLKER
jgi:hypothetical protein